MFEGDNKGLAVVPKGAALHGWKVIDVQHGSATVKNNGVQIRLVVGGVEPTGNIKRGDNSSKAPSQPAANAAPQEADSRGSCDGRPPAQGTTAPRKTLRRRELTTGS